MCWAATLNGLPVAMFGANRLSEEIAGIWLLASPGIYTNKRDFMRKCRDHIVIMHERYEYLTNFIDARNLPTQRWLPRLGFKPARTSPVPLPSSRTLDPGGTIPWIRWNTMSW